MVGVALGAFLTSGSVPFVRAGEVDPATSTKVDPATLDKLYDAAFGRPADSAGKSFHVGRDLSQVLHDINNSEEKRYYSALFKAVKAYEEAVRAPGTLTSEEKERYLKYIDSALATLLAWVETLPEQDICDGAVGIIEAREAIQSAYDKMSPAAKLAAQKGVFKALETLPKDLPVPSGRCQIPKPTCQPRPACLDVTTYNTITCLIPEPVGGWCPVKPLPTPCTIDASGNKICPSPKPTPPHACTAEAKICPDGSAVGRTGPNCEFAPCPSSAGTTNH